MSTILTYKQLVQSRLLQLELATVAVELLEVSADPKLREILSFPSYFSEKTM